MNIYPNSHKSDVIQYKLNPFIEEHISWATQYFLLRYNEGFYV